LELKGFLKLLVVPEDIPRNLRGKSIFRIVANDFVLESIPLKKFFGLRNPNQPNRASIRHLTPQTEIFVHDIQV